MGKSKHKEFNKEPKDGEISKLKRRIARLEKENSVLKSQLRTYDKVFEKNIKFLKAKTDEFSLDELIQGAQDQQNLAEIREEKRYKFEEMKKKWLCYKCNEGVLKLMIVPGNKYFRKCTICDNRTEAKEYNDDVEGIR